MNNNKRNVKFEFELLKSSCLHNEPKLVVRKFRKEKGSRLYSFCALYILNSKHDIVRFHHYFNQYMTLKEFTSLIGNLKELTLIKG